MFAIKAFDKPSSMLAGYAIEGTDLVVQFAGGKQYRYLGAAVELDKLLAADSAGKFVNATIKPNYKFEAVE